MPCSSHPDAAIYSEGLFWAPFEEPQKRGEREEAKAAVTALSLCARWREPSAPSSATTTLHAQV